MVQNGSPYLSVKKNLRWTVRGRSWSSSQSSARISSKYEGGVPQKSSKSRNGPEWSTLLVCQKKFRWTARVRTWSSPPSSARTSSILLDAPFSKCQGLTRKYYGPTIQPTTLTTPTNPSTQQTYPPTPPKTFNHEGGVPQKSSESKKVLEWSPLLVCQKKFKPSLQLDLIDSKSSWFL